MKPKTQMRLERRLRGLPVHHIDTSILLRARTTDEGLQCQKYIDRVGLKYRGVLSFPVLAELFSVILRLEPYADRHDFLDTIDQMIKVRRIELYSPRYTAEIVGEIFQADHRIDPLDREIVACAIENRATALITLDKALVHNRVIEDAFNISIRHPKELA